MTPEKDGVATSTDSGENSSSATKLVPVDPDTSFAWNPKVACRTLEETAFILLNSRMLRLNDVGTRIWELFENGSTVAKVVDDIVEEFDVTREQATQDAQPFVAELVAKQVLIASSKQSSGGDL